MNEVEKEKKSMLPAVEIKNNQYKICKVNLQKFHASIFTIGTHTFLCRQIFLQKDLIIFFLFYNKNRKESVSLNSLTYGRF